MKLKDLTARIEGILAEYYGFEIELSARDCLLEVESDEPSDPCRPEAPAAAPRGEMLVVQENDLQENDLYVGLKFSRSTVEQAVIYDESEPFTPGRIAALLVIIEEVSHFHLLTQRAQFDLTTTQLELEWQSEVDKLIVLSELAGDGGARVILRGLHYFLVLGFQLREGLGPEESMRYREATHYFDLFWQDKLAPLLSQGVDFGMKDPAVRAALRELYRLPWSAKTSIMVA